MTLFNITALRCVGHTTTAERFGMMPTLSKIIGALNATSADNL